MRTFDNNHIHRKGKLKRKKGANSNLAKIRRFVASLNNEQISRMIEDSAGTYVTKDTDTTARSIYENSVNPQQKIQPKLNISQPHDKSEMQADKVAEGVTKGDVQLSKSALEQPVSDINTKGEGSGMTTTPEFDQQLGGTKGQGQKLDANVRSEMESHLGSDLSGVNIHTGGDAKSMSEDINAKAFTHGQDVYFNEGQYNPSSNAGKSLLAHELTHTVQQGAGKVQAKIQRFGAESHEKIESNALTKERGGKKGFNSAEAHATYYGNWTRDFNQFLAPGIVTDNLGFDVAYTLVAFMAAIKFGKQPSLGELGVYNPKEHIDNPGAIYPGQDIYADPAKQQLKNPNLSPATKNKPPETPQVIINTEMSVNQTGTTEKGVGLMSVDQTGVMAYIRDSNAHVERRLEAAVEKGRGDDGLFHFGVALHAIEDLFAHSNYVEIALAKILKDEPSLLKDQLQGADRDVYKYMPSVSGQDKHLRPILTTGTFSPEDAMISLSYEAIAFLDKFNVDNPGDVDFGPVAENAFMNLLSALSQNSTIKHAIGGKVGAALEKAIHIAGIAIKIERIFDDPNMKLDDLYRSIKASIKKSKATLEKILETFSIDIDLPDFDKMFLKFLIKKTLEWLKEKLKQVATGAKINTQVAKTPLNEEKKRLEEEIAEQDAQLDDPKTSAGKKKTIQKDRKYNVSHLDMYKNRAKQSSGKMLLSGPSHSQLAKDHPESIFFGLAFKLATEADVKLRDKLMTAWNGKPVQVRTTEEIQKADQNILKSKMGGAAVEKYGSTSADVYDIEGARAAANMSMYKAIVALKLINKNDKYKSAIQELYVIKKGILELKVYDYESRQRLYQQLRNVVYKLNEETAKVNKTTKVSIKGLLLEAASFLAPAFFKEQKDNIKNTKAEDITRSTVKQDDLSGKSPAVKDLLNTSREILGHPNDSNWWKFVVREYIKKFPKQIAMEIKLKNAGYVDKNQAK